jgi:hypothetical protein
MRALWTFASLATFTAFVIKLGEQLDKSVSTQAKESARTFVKSAKPSEFIALAAITFNNALDAVFGKKHLSVHCFRRSVAASALTGLVVTVANDAMVEGGLFSPSRDAIVELALMSALLMVVNCVPDYISLLKSRYFVRKMAQSPTTTRAVLLATYELLATALLGLSIVAYPVFRMHTANGLFSWSLLPDMARDVFIPHRFSSAMFPDFTALFPLFFYTTFMTSIWALIYVVSAIIVRFATPLDRAVENLRWFLDIDQQPYKSLCHMIVLLTWIVVAPLIAIRLIL